MTNILNLATDERKQLLEELRAPGAASNTLQIQVADMLRNLAIGDLHDHEAVARALYGALDGELQIALRRVNDPLVRRFWAPPLAA